MKDPDKFDELIDQYGETPVRFSSYYKFSFTFVGQLPDGREIKCGCGGSADDIYRDHVEAGKDYPLKEVAQWVSLKLEPSDAEPTLIDGRW